MGFLDFLRGTKGNVVVSEQHEKKNAETGVLVAPTFQDAIPPLKKSSDYLQGTATGWVFACANAIANAVAHTNFKLYRVTADGPVEITKHPLLDLIYKVNGHTTSFDHFYRVQMFLEGVGEAPLYLSRPSPNAKPTSMILLRPDRLEIQFDEKTIIGGYRYRKESGSMIDIDAKDIIFLRNPSLTSEFRGMGTLQAAAVTVDTEEFAEKYNRNFFYNGARPDFVLQTEQKLSEATASRLKKMWESLYKGVENSHKMAILEQGLEAKSLGLSQKDMDFLEQLRWSRDKILAIFQIPRSILGITEDVNRANAEAAEVTFSKYVIKPRLERLVQQLNEFLCPQFGDDLYFDYDDPTPDDLVTKAAYYSQALTAGWMTTNEIRALEGLPAMRGGDTILRPFGLQPAVSPEAKSTDKSFNHPGILTLEKKNKKIRSISQREKIHGAGKYSKDEKREAVADAIKPLIKSLISREKTMHKSKKQAEQKDSVEQKDFAPMLKTVEERDAFQKMLNVKSVARFEELISDKLSQAFDVQEKIVLQNLKGQNTLKRYRKDPGDAEAKRIAEELLKAIWDADADQLESLLEANVSPVMLDLIREQGANTANYLNIQVGDVTQDPKTAKIIAETTLKLVGSVNETTRENIMLSVSEGVRAGEGITKITERIKEVFVDADTARAEMIARSEAIRGSNFAAEEVYRQSGIRYKEWITASDERTCPFCDSMDGKQLEVGDSFWEKGQTMNVDGQDLRFNYLDVNGPPLHPNCRCTLGPVIEI